MEQLAASFLHEKAGPPQSLLAPENPNTAKNPSISNLHAGSIKFGRSVVYGLQVFALHAISKNVFNREKTLTQAINSGPIGMDLDLVFCLVFLSLERLLQSAILQWANAGWLPDAHPATLSLPSLKRTGRERKMEKLS